MSGGDARRSGATATVEAFGELLMALLTNMTIITMHAIVAVPRLGFMGLRPVNRVIEPFSCRRRIASREKSRERKDRQAIFAAPAVAASLAGTELVKTSASSDAALQDFAARLAGEDAVRRSGEDLRRAMRAAGGGRARDRAAAGDQIVEDDRDAARDVARENLARHAPLAARLVHERLGDGAAAAALQPLPEQLGALLAAEIGRDHDDRRLADERREMAGEQRMGVERDGFAAKGVLEGCDIVHVYRDDGVRSSSRRIAARRNAS